MNLKRKQKKGRRNQSGQKQRHKAVSAGCQFWFKPAPSKARSFASVLARVVPTPALAPLDKKHQRSSRCGLPYHLKQRQLGYWTVPGTTLLGAICFYLATKSWKPPKNSNLASFISSRSCLTRSNLGRSTVPCQTVSNQLDGLWMYVHRYINRITWINDDSCGAWRLTWLNLFHLALQSYFVFAWA